MRNLKYVVLVAMTCLLPSARASYFVISPSAAPLDPAARTHIVVAGQGNDLGHAPQVAASSKVKKLIETNPGDQVLFISTSRTDSNDSYFRKMGYTHIRFVPSLLNPKQLNDELTKYTAITSLHFYGHGAIPEGVFLDQVGERDVRWYPTDTAQAKRLRGHFTDDAYVTLNGCNGAHVLASTWSKLWSIPVSGAMVGTHFEALFKDGNYYSADQGTESQWATQTVNSRQQSISCAGNCYRMRPDNANYHGHYGNYRQGLPFYKFFCVGISSKKCQLAMARSITSDVGPNAIPANPTYGQFAQAVREWLCPTGPMGSDAQKKCINELTAIDLVRSSSAEFSRNFTPFLGLTAQCNFQSCYSNLACLNPANTSSCAISGATPKVGQSTTFVDEYMHYLAGYMMSQQNQSAAPSPEMRSPPTPE